MAALSETDLRMILGDNYEAALQAKDEDLSEEERRKQARNHLEARIRACENSRLSAVFLVIGGAILIWAGWMVSGYTLTIQVMLGIAVCVLGLLWFFYLLGAMRKLLPQRAVLAVA